MNICARADWLRETIFSVINILLLVICLCLRSLFNRRWDFALWGCIIFFLKFYGFNWLKRESKHEI